MAIAIVVAALIGAYAVYNLQKEEEKIIIIGFDTAAAREHVVQLISNGPRMSGSAAELQGAEYTIRQSEHT